MEPYLFIVIWVAMVFGIVGAYAMSLSMLLMVTEGEGRKMYLAFIFPGMIYVVAFSFMGFLWGLRFWDLFGKEGPIQSIVGSWKENPIDCTISTIGFIGIWLLLVYLTGNVNWPT